MRGTVRIAASLLLVLSVIAALTLLSKDREIVACTECNVILISADSVRADRVGLLGDGDLTPHIDRSFADGLIFERYRTASYLTPITEMAVHTGLYPTQTGVTGFGSVLPTTTPMLAERLKAFGYDTAAFGTSPEFFYFIPAMEDSFSRGFDSYFVQEREEASVPAIYTVREQPPTTAIAWLEERKRTDNPFFLWIALGTAHFPYGRWCPGMEEYEGFFAGKSLHWNNDTLRRVFDGQIWSLEEPGVVLSPLTDADASYISSCYDGNVAMMDTYVGSILDVLKTSNLDHNTIVILASEHGEDMGEHGTFLHMDIYSGNVNAPLLITYPKVKAARIPHPVESIDILPTLWAILGLSPDPSMEGVVALPESPDEVKREYAVSMRTPLWENGIGDAPTLRDIQANNYVDRVFPQFLETLPQFRALTQDNTPDLSIESREWKLIWRRQREAEREYGWWSTLTGKPLDRPEYELYRLSEDPQEHRNVYGQYPDVEQELRTRLESWIATYESSPSSPRDTLPIQPYF